MIRRAKDESRAIDSHLDIPVPEGLSLFPYQKAGVEYILARPNTLLADEMGLGKSCMSVAVSNCLPEVRRVLIICPASLKINWQREWQRWDTKGLSVGIAGKTFPDTEVCIINYDILKKYRKELRQQEYDLIIVDECHYLKSGKADIMVATDIAARGIDIDGITHVINFELSNIAESYVHRIGRTARAGASGSAISLVTGEEKSYLANVEKTIQKLIPVESNQPYHSEGALRAPIIGVGKAKALIEGRRGQGPRRRSKTSR